jgi:hypothetical protein
MVPPLAGLLLGERFERNLDLLAASVIFIGTFLSYALGLFTGDGGVVFLPVDATSVGLIVAAGIGYRRGSLLVAWGALFAAYLAFHAEWAFLGLSSHSLVGKLTFLFDPVILVIFTMASVFFGTTAFAVGYLVEMGIERIRGASTDS